MPDKNTNNPDLKDLVENPEPEIMEDEFVKDRYVGEEENALLQGAKRLGLFIFEIVKVVLISLAIILPIRYFLVQPFIVQGASMEPNFHDREYLIINEVEYRLGKPERGEVAILKDPRDAKTYLIKRVIGLPSEKVEIKNGRVFINDQELNETYIADFGNETFDAVTLGDKEYYVLGDNRTNSFDSRRFGPINEQDMIGKVWVRGWPLNKLNTFNLPKY